MPISAVCTTEEVFYPMMYPNPFMHTTTTGGGALACSAAIAAIHVTLRERLWEQAAVKGDYLIPRLQTLCNEHSQIYEKITGKGLLIGMHFKSPQIGYKVASGLFKRGVLVSGTLTSAQTIRIEPPLIVTIEQLDMMLERLEDTLKSVSRSMEHG
jgi:putrescine aminotransferase